jgi:hypothetical protein
LPSLQLIIQQLYWKPSNRRRKKSAKEEPYFDLGLERGKMEFYRIMIFLPF